MSEFWIGGKEVIDMPMQNQPNLDEMRLGILAKLVADAREELKRWGITEIPPEESEKLERIAYECADALVLFLYYFIVRMKKAEAAA